MDTIRQDLRYALRGFGRSPGFTLVAVLTLALGIGANSAIFSVVQGVLLRPLPFAEPDRLVMLYTGYPDDEYRYPLSAPDFMSYQADSRSFSGVAAVDYGRQTLTGSGEPAEVQVGMTGDGFLDVLGVSPILGRPFHPEENQPGRNEVALLSHAYWQSHFGGDPSAVGRTLTLNGITRDVVGVLPPDFDYPAGRQLYYPLAYNETFDPTTAQGRRSEFLTVVARLAPGVTREQAIAEVAAISSRLQVEFPETNSANINISVVPLRDHLIGDVRLPLVIMLGAVGLVLLIACVNVANLLLARAAAREGELAVRAALGAGRGRMIRQLLTESVALGVAGGAAGLLLALWGTRALVAAGPDGIPRLESIGIDPAVVAFTALLAVATGLLFGLLPALQVSRTDLSRSLREGGRGSLGGRRNRARPGLVVTELAFAVMLLVGAGLLIRSFLALTAVDPGFRSDRLLTLTLSPPSAAYGTGESVRQFHRDVLERVASLPGVEMVAGGSEVPLDGTGNVLGFSIENREAPPPGFVVDAAVSAVTPGYFATLGIPVRAGRPIDERDHVEAPDVIVVNEAFVRRYFPGENPLGQRLDFGNGDLWEIVGVVGDAPQYTLDQPVRPAIFAPHEQFTTRFLRVIARTSGDPLAMTGVIRREIATIDANIPVQRFTTGDELLSQAVAQPRFYTVLLAIFGGVALLLAAVGIFGVISYMVTQRTREIGIRLALGARPADVLAMVVQHGAVLAAAGVALGLLAAAAGSRLLAGMLYGVGTHDPIAFASVAVLLLAVALLASYLPASRATRVEPMVALRSE